MRKSLFLYFWLYIRINIVHNKDINNVDVTGSKNFTITNAQNTRNVFQRLLMFFPRHLRVYHYENQTIADMEIAYRNYANVQNQPSLFFNYNLEGEFLRPFGDACINMVFLTNVSDFNRFYDIAYNVKSTDVILIILYMPAYTNDREYDTSRAVLIYQKWNNFVKVIHYHSEKEFSIIDITTELSDFETYENSFQVFKTIDIAYKTCSPFIFEENQSQLNGIEYKILEVVMDKLNFTFQLVNYSNTPVRLILEDVIIFFFVLNFKLTMQCFLVK